MLKKSHQNYTPYKKEFVIDLQKTYGRIFNLALEKFIAKS